MESAHVPLPNPRPRSWDPVEADERLALVVGLLAFVGWEANHAFTQNDAGTKALYRNPLLGSVLQGKLAIEIDSLRSVVIGGFSDPSTAASAPPEVTKHKAAIDALIEGAYQADLDGNDHAGIQQIQTAIGTYTTWGLDSLAATAKTGVGAQSQLIEPNKVAPVMAALSSSLDEKGRGGSELYQQNVDTNAASRQLHWIVRAFFARCCELHGPPRPPPRDGGRCPPGKH